MGALAGYTSSGHSAYGDGSTRIGWWEAEVRVSELWLQRSQANRPFVPSLAFRWIPGTLGDAHLQIWEVSEGFKVSDEENETESMGERHRPHLRGWF